MAKYRRKDKWRTKKAVPDKTDFLRAPWMHKRWVNSISEELQIELAMEAKERGISFIRHFIKTAYDDNKVLIALANKILPNLKEIYSENIVQGSLHHQLGSLTDEQLDQNIAALDGERVQGEVVSSKKRKKVKIRKK